jgi:hypothetical protein
VLEELPQVMLIGAMDCRIGRPYRRVKLAPEIVQNRRLV